MPPIFIWTEPKRVWSSSKACLLRMLKDMELFTLSYLSVTDCWLYQRNTNTSIGGFYVHVTVHRNKFLFHKTNRLTNFPNLFCQETLDVSGSSSAHHQKFSPVLSPLVYVMQVWWQLWSTTILVVLQSCHQTCMTYTTSESTGENSWWWAEELPETSRVSWQNKFGKLVCLLVLLKRNFHRRRCAGRVRG